MDVLGIFELPNWLVGILSTFLVCPIVYTTYKQSIFWRLNIPGPKPWPFLGSMPEIVKNGVFQLEKENVEKYGKCFGSFLGNIPQLIITDLKMIEEIFVKNFNSFSIRSQQFPMTKVWRNSVAQAKGEHWKHMRSALSPLFAISILKNMETLFSRCLDTFISILEQKRQQSNVVDFLSAYEALTLDFICRSVFGAQIDAQKTPNNLLVRLCRRLTKVSNQANPVLLSTILFPELKHLYEFLDKDYSDLKTVKRLEMILQQITEKQNHANMSGCTNFLQLMINTQTNQTSRTLSSVSSKYDAYKSRKLTNDEIISNAILFLIAGFDTTKTTLTFASYCLATNLQCQNKLISEIDTGIGQMVPSYDNVAKLQYLDWCISETLRLYPPVLRIQRQSVSETTVCGIKIPYGMTINVPVYALHRMSEYWTEPELFIPERFSPENKAKINSYSYMPFGVGPRTCLGNQTALTEVKFTIVRLLQKYRLLPSAGLNIPPKLENGMFLKPVDGMKLWLEKR